MTGRGGTLLRGPLAALAACALAAGCGLQPAPPEASLETLDSLIPRARQGDAEALQFVAPAGGVLPFLSDPYAAAGTQAKQVAGQDGLNVFPSFSEGRPAAYAITEYWDAFPKVWAQPLYFLVTGFNPATGGPIFVDGQAVFSIGTGSRFYSSYWQIYYAVVPASLGTVKTADYSSEKALFDNGFTMVKGAVTFCALGPQNANLAWDGQTVPAPTASDPTATRPVTRHPLIPSVTIPLRGTGTGWVEGQKVWFIDFGRNRFRMDDKLVVEADALFKFAVRGADGLAHPIGLPSVGGTAPLHVFRAPELVQGVPQFGSLWHEYQVILNPPNGALPGASHPPAPFIPAGAAGLRAKVAAAVADAGGNASYGALYTPVPDAGIEAAAASNGASIAEYTLRVAQNPFDCFQQRNDKFPGGPCVWIDSQRALETLFGEELISDSGRLSSCPLVYFNGAVIP